MLQAVAQAVADTALHLSVSQTELPSFRMQTPAVLQGFAPQLSPMLLPLGAMTEAQYADGDSPHMATGPPARLPHMATLTPYLPHMAGTSNRRTGTCMHACMRRTDTLPHMAGTSNRRTGTCIL